MPFKRKVFFSLVFLLLIQMSLIAAGIPVITELTNVFTTLLILSVGEWIDGKPDSN